MSQQYSEQSYSSSSQSGGSGGYGGSAQFVGGAAGTLGGGSSSYREEVSYTSGGGSRGASGLGFSAGGAGGFSSESYSSGGSSGSAGAVSQIAQDLVQLNQNRRASGAGASFSANGGGASFQQSGGASFNANAGGSFQQSSSSASFNASSSQSGSGAFLSAIETSILRSTVPVEISETENLTVSFQGRQETGIWANRSEVVNWRGVIPITEYILNEDMNPEVITKRTEQNLVYIQELAIRYLRPPTPPAPGEILIRQEMNTHTPPAPPLVIRQAPARASTPEPLVVREAPPQPPAAVGRKLITISGKRIPPAPRKVVIERLAPLPSKPQSVLVERWLPYAQVKRRVVFQRSEERDAVVIKPRNVIVQWEAPQVQIKKEFKYLGVIRANPVEYVQRYGATLKVARELPDFVLEIKTPEGLVLAADYQYNSVHELEGDVRALSFIDLDREGLSEYRAMLSKMGISYVGAAGVIAAASQFQASGSSSSYSASSSSGSAGFAGQSGSAGFGGQSSLSIHGGSSHSAHGSSSHSSGAGGANSAVIAEIFNSIDRDHSGQISIEEAARVLLKLNSRLNRHYGEDESKAFFAALDVDRNGQLSLDEFRRAFERLL